MSRSRTRCVAGFCSRGTTESVSLHKFPADASVNIQWNAFVKRTRKDWTSHTKNSKLCSEHFSKECYSSVPEVKESLGFAVQ